MTKDEIAAWLHDELQGTGNDLMTTVENAIEDGMFTQDEFNSCEPYIYNYIDNFIFLCDSCGWWFDMGDMAENDNWECESCESETHR